MQFPQLLPDERGGCQYRCRTFAFTLFRRGIAFPNVRFGMGRRGVDGPQA